MAAPDGTRPTTGPAAGDAAAVVVVVALATLLVLTVFTTPLAAIGPIGTSLGSGVAGRAWILSSMSIGLAATLLPAGAVADDVGRRAVLLAGAVLLAVGCLVCALAPVTGVFVVGRLVQGVGGAAVTAAGLGALGHAFPDPAGRARATGVWGASVGAGIALGPLLATASDAVVSWRAAYAVLTVASLGAAAAARVRVAPSRSPQPRGVDAPGALLLAGSVSCLLAGLVEGRQDWTGAAALGLFAGAVVLAVALVAVESRTAAPMIEPALLRAPAFGAATVGAFVTGTGPIALFSYLAAFTGPALGFSVLTASLLLLGWSGTSVVTALLARRLPTSVSGRAQLGWGLLVVGVALAWLVTVDAGSGVGRFLPGVLLAGVATGVVNAALGREAVASVPPGRAGLGSGANNTARYLGSALGVTVVVVLVTSRGVGPALCNHTGIAVSGWNCA